MVCSARLHRAARESADAEMRKRSIVFTTNKNPKRWGAVLHEDDGADAIVDSIHECGRLFDSTVIPSEPNIGPSFATKRAAHGQVAPFNQAAEFPEPTPRQATPVHLAPNVAKQTA